MHFLQFHLTRKKIYIEKYEEFIEDEKMLIRSYTKSILTKAQEWVKGICSRS